MQSSSPQTLPAGPSGAVAELRDSSAVLSKLLKNRQENKELDLKIEKRRQRASTLQKHFTELERNAEEMKSQTRATGRYMTEQRDQLLKKAERERKERLEKDAEIKMLKVEHAELTERKQKLQQEVRSQTVFKDFMERVVKMTEYKDVQSLSNYLETLLSFKGQLYQKLNSRYEEVDQLRHALLTLQEQHHSRRLHRSMQLSKLHDELENASLEAKKWESRWSSIQETVVKKTLLLVQIKTVILNLYEMIHEREEEGDGEDLDMNDIDKQLSKVKIFIQDFSEIVKHQNVVHTDTKTKATGRTGKRSAESRVKKD